MFFFGGVGEGNYLCKGCPFELHFGILWNSCGEDIRTFMSIGIFKHMYSNMILESYMVDIDRNI